jgi:endonuclease III
MLCGIQSVAVDVHMNRFVVLAGITPGSYAKVKSVVQGAAELMGVAYTTLDYSIWRFMATRRRTPNQAL